MAKHVSEEAAKAYVVGLLQGWGYLQVRVKDVVLIWEHGVALTQVSVKAFDPASWQHVEGRFDVWFEDGDTVYGEW